MGVKEQLSLDSLQTTEQEAAALLPPDMALEDVYAPIRRAVRLAAHPPPPLSVPAATSAADKEADGEPGAAASAAASSSSVSAMASTAEAEAQAQGEVEEGEVRAGPDDKEKDGQAGRLDIYKAILGAGDEDEQAGDNLKEAILLGEVGRFRMRQMERDRCVGCWGCLSLLRVSYRVISCSA